MLLKKKKKKLLTIENLLQLHEQPVGSKHGGKELKKRM